MPGAARTKQAATPKDMANAVRALAMDAVQQANSGHPGMPMGMADAATVLFTRFLKFDPANPDWPDRDRFVLSAGHGSMLLYALLYLTGYADMPIDEIRNFRQLGSKCAGHPEYGEAAGIETTTGPLGQGIANAVGMALAEKLLSTRFGSDLVDHRTYAIAGDGCLMEGISHEAMGLAGHLKLNKLIVLFDDNGITIDGATELATSEDVPARVAAYGWNVLHADGHDPEAVAAALQAAQDSDKPTLIACKTHIGYGSPNKVDTAGAHGAPLGEDEIVATRAALGWDAPPFEVPGPVLEAWRAAGKRCGVEFAAWKDRHAAADAGLRGEFDRRLAGTLPETLDQVIADYKRELASELPSVATRKASQNALDVINPVVVETVGGSADLTGSNNTLSKDMGIVTPEDFSGRFVHYGIR
ncbi:MAG TPA: transketolase, partial [Alphaproteobacteria bacterium]|nr:transketolase [Alphaproteobacteria bacterium]